MSISITVNNYSEIVEAELFTLFMPEEIKKLRSWYFTNNSDTFKEYQEKIKPIEDKYYIDLIHGNFHELWSMLNLESEDSGKYQGTNL